MSPSLRYLLHRRAASMEEGDSPEFQVAPMVDVLLVLLLFFMSIGSSELFLRSENICLPEIRSGIGTSNDRQEIVLQVAPDSSPDHWRLVLDGETFHSADLIVKPLKNRLRNNPTAHILIRAEKEMPYATMATILSSCHEAGFQEVTFGVIVHEK